MLSTQIPFLSHRRLFLAVSGIKAKERISGRAKSQVAGWVIISTVWLSAYWNRCHMVKDRCWWSTTAFCFCYWWSFPCVHVRMRRTRVSETTKALNVWMRDVPASHCRITRCAEGALPPAATGTVSKTGNLQPESRSCGSSPSPKRGCPPLPISRGLSPGEDIVFSLLKAWRCSQLQPPELSGPLLKTRLARSRARRVGSRAGTAGSGQQGGIVFPVLLFVLMIMYSGVLQMFLLHLSNS